MIRQVKGMTIARRLPTMIIAMILLLSAALSTFALSKLSQTLHEQSAEKTQLLLSEYAYSIESWVDGLFRDLLSTAQNPSVIEAMNSLLSSRKMLGGDANTTLRRLYVTENPNGPNDRHLLSAANADGFYHATHGRSHEIFLNLHQVLGFQDVYLIDLEGNVVYSIFKGNEFATNLSEPSQSETSLAQVFEEAVQADSGSISQSDYGPDAPGASDGTGYLATPVFRNGADLIGVLAVKAPWSKLGSALRIADFLSMHGNVYIVGKDRTSRTEAIGTGGFGRFENPPRLAESGLSTNTTSNARYLGGQIFVEPLSVGIDGWSIIAELDETYVAGKLGGFQALLAAFAVGGLVLSALLGLLIARSITIPLGAFAEAMGRVAARDFEAEIPGMARGDELGTISRVLAEFRERLRESEEAEQERSLAQDEQMRVVGDLADHLQRLAAGDLGATIDHPFPEVYEPLRQDFNSTLETLTDLMRSIVENAEEIRSRAEEIGDASSDLSNRTENQAATLEQTAAALDQLTSSVRAAADGASEVETVVVSARRDAEESGPVVRAAVAAMSEIKKSSDEISQIIGVIDDIAFQTNLLALNAGVEAARAGEAGRGFAVVASEVRALAKRSSDAAREIKDLIGSSSGQVETGVGLVDQTGAALNSIVHQVGNIAELVGDIASGAKEQSAGLGEINLGVTQLDEVTQQNAAMVQQSTSAGMTLKQEAASLSNLVARFSFGDAGTAPVAAPVVAFKRHQKEPTAPRSNPDRPLDLPRRAVAAGEGTWQDF